MTARQRAIVLLVAACVTGAVPLGAQQGTSEVLTRAELEAGGWTRLSELPFAIRGAARVTVDGIGVHGSLGAVPAWPMAPGRDEWLVLIDDQPVATAFAGLTALDLLPVSLSQLDSVVVQRAPGIAAGRLAMNGVLRLYTRRVDRGLHGSAAHYSGNEVGDPGPFTFTPERTANVDNSGPFHEARAAWGAGAGGIDLALRRWTDNLTDLRLAARHEAAAAPAAPELWVRQLAPTLHARLVALGGTHDLHAGTAQLRGTTFVPALQADQSLATRLTFGGVSGSMQAAPLSYRVSASRLRTGPYGAPLPSTLAHDRDALAGSVTFRAMHGRASVDAGATLEHRAIGSMTTRPAGPVRDAATTGDAFAAIRLDVPSRPRLHAAAGRGVAGLRGGAALDAAAALDSVTVVHVSVAGASRAYGDDGAWMDLQLFGLGSLADERRVSALASVELRRAPARAAALTVGAILRRETGLRLLAIDTAAVVPDAPARVSPALTLTAGELLLAADLPARGAVSGGATYRLSQPLGGWVPAREALGSLPRHLLDASLVVQPYRDIRVRPALHLASRTRWSGVDGRVEEVPAVVRVDLSLEKWFFDRHLRAQLLARNLLNDVERYHALGADFRLRVFAGATLSF